jgi:hypothetical protein
LGGERAFRESDSIFIGDWNILFGVVVFGYLMMQPQGLVARVGGECYNQSRAN